MTHSFSSADLRTTLSFPFQSQHWATHFLVGSGLLFANTFIPFVPAIIVYGYITRLLRNTIDGQALAMPEWTDWGGLFKDGLRSTAIGIVYLGPSLIVMFGGFAVYFATMMFGVITTENGSMDSPSLLFPVFMLGAMAVLFISMFLGWFFSTLGLLPLPMALAHSASRSGFLAAFDLRTFWNIIRADKWGYLLSWVIVMGVFGLAYVVFILLYSTVILCMFSYILMTPLSFYMLLVAAALFGNFYRDNATRPQPVEAVARVEPLPGAQIQ